MFLWNEPERCRERNCDGDVRARQIGASERPVKMRWALWAFGAGKDDLGGSMSVRAADLQDVRIFCRIILRVYPFCFARSLGQPSCLEGDLIIIDGGRIASTGNELSQ